KIDKKVVSQESIIKQDIPKEQIKSEIKTDTVKPEIIKTDIKDSIKDDVTTDKKVVSQESIIKQDIPKEQIKPEIIKTDIKDTVKDDTKIDKKVVSQESIIKQDIPKEQIKPEIIKTDIKDTVKDDTKIDKKVVSQESIIKQDIPKEQIKPEIKTDIVKPEIIKDDTKVDKKLESNETVKIDKSFINNEDIKITDELIDFINDTNKKPNNESQTTNKSSSDLKNPFLANSFLSGQTHLKEMISKQQINESKKVIEENKDLKSVMKSADMLDLNPEKIKVKSDVESVKPKIIDDINNKNINLNNTTRLDKMVIDNKLENLDDTLAKPIKDQQNIVANKADISVKNDDTKDITKKEVVVNLSVPSDVTQTIQSKIIGAQQKVGNFMSEVARNMYLNYKPPVTAFRMNLNPDNLGNISIVMRTNKVDNSLSVSMNMSNSGTMETFSENKNALQSALQRNFSDSSSVTLNFGTQSESDNSSSQNFSQNSNQQNQDNQQNVVNNTNNEDQEEDALETIENYM
ncbi:MAG: flagellar hook-length control protein FliK, partial [Campylobacterota bacterium]|nr:flagellar hook-length control protein FliK [Campylobacterota bacterium]